MRNFRDNGAIGALLDEYEKAILELQRLLDTISHAELTTIVDNETKDPDCISIKTILNHILNSGYRYVVEIRKLLGEQIIFSNITELNKISDYKNELNNLIKFNERLFEDYPNMEIEELDTKNKIVVASGQSYDVEQLFEHAIVHILRHRRQMEKFVIKLR